MKKLKVQNDLKDIRIDKVIATLAPEFSRDFIIENFPELILDSDLKNYNSGLTLVFLKK